MTVNTVYSHVPRGTRSFASSTETVINGVEDGFRHVPGRDAVVEQHRAPDVLLALYLEGAVAAV